jgi:hypothetical protein
MNVLILIISDDSLPHYKNNKDVWRSYMNSRSNIHCYFIECITDESKVYPYIENNTIYFKGVESRQNILIKTINAMEYFMNSGVQYDFIVRTNLSTVWDFDTLNRYINTLPKEKIYAGSTGPFYNPDNYNVWFYFVGGMGIIMSNDVCKLIIENRKTAESFKIIDDIDIGYALSKINIPILSKEFLIVSSLADFEQKREIIKTRREIFYRAKSSTENRVDESTYMLKIMNLIYEVGEESTHSD